jgi:hypothetical protein
MPYTDLSVDLETLGTEPGCVITQIGLCAFNSRDVGASVKSAYLIRVDPQSCLDLGMHVSWSTISWWLRQEEAARMFMAEAGGAPLSVALSHAGNFMAEHFDLKEFKIWGHGATFDVSLLNEAYRLCKLPVPWAFRNVRDTRTLIDLRPCDGAWRKVEGTAHNAADDALAQAEWVQRCIARIEK